MKKQKVVNSKSPLRIFFREYLEALKGYHGLPNHEAKLLAELMYNYHILEGKLPDDKFRWKVLLKMNLLMDGNVEQWQKYAWNFVMERFVDSCSKKDGGLDVLLSFCFEVAHERLTMIR